MSRAEALPEKASFPENTWSMAIQFLKVT